MNSTKKMAERGEQSTVFESRLTSSKPSSSEQKETRPASRSPGQLKQGKEMNQDIRYPYTYAADFVRSLAGYCESRTKISRSDASKIQSGIAKAIGMDDYELAAKLADHYKLNEE